MISIHDTKIYHIDSYLDLSEIEVISSNDKVDEVLIRIMFDKISVTDFRVEMNNGVHEISIMKMRFEEHGGYIFVSNKHCQLKGQNCGIKSLSTSQVI